MFGTVLIFLDILAFQYCFSYFLSHVLWVLLLDSVENNCPGGEILARLFCPRDRGLARSLCPRGEEFALSKTFPKCFPRGMVRLGTD